MPSPFREIGACNCHECQSRDQMRTVVQQVKDKYAELEEAIRLRDSIIADLQEDLYYWRESFENGWSK